MKEAWAQKGLQRNTRVDHYHQAIFYNARSHVNASTVTAELPTTVSVLHAVGIPSFIIQDAVFVVSFKRMYTSDTRKEHGLS